MNSVIKQTLNAKAVINVCQRILFAIEFLIVKIIAMKLTVVHLILRKLKIKILV